MDADAPLAFSLREQIADRLRADIMCGRLKEGETLTELKLVERFGVSRTPVREALLQLSQEGLLEGKANAGVKVAKRPPDAIRELIVPIRCTLETYALRECFAKLTQRDFDNWQAILDRMREACERNDYPAIAEHDIEFHRAILRRAGERDLEQIWMGLLGRVRSHFSNTQRKNYDAPIQIHAEHVEILEAFKSGDVERAVRVLAESIS
jgi:DNA-binding GntR family transcriptional regulator